MWFTVNVAILSSNVLCNVFIETEKTEFVAVITKYNTYNSK